MPNEFDLEEARACIAKGFTEFQKKRASLDAANSDDYDRHLVMTGAAQLYGLVFACEKVGLLELPNYPEIMAVLAAVTDVWTRGRSPLFTKSKPRRGRPPLSFTDSAVRQCCVRALAILSSAGEKQNVASRFVCAELSRARVVLSDGNKITLAQLASWWGQSHGHGADTELAALVSREREKKQQPLHYVKEEVVRQIRSMALYSWTLKKN